MKSLSNFTLFLVSAAGLVAAPLPETLDGPVRGHLTGTNPNEYSYTSHPHIDDFGKIEEGALVFKSYVFRDFDQKETPRYIEYRATAGKIDVRIFITKPHREFYTLTLRKDDGGYERYQIQKNARPPEPDFRAIISRAKYIVIGTIGPSAAGGGGTTSSINISNVLHGGMENNSIITVFWATKKGLPSNLKADVIWFLDPSSEHEGSYVDIAPDLAHILATPENLEIIASAIK